VSEHDEQVALFQWTGYNLVPYPELSMLYAVPNGGQRHPVVAAKLKAEGVKSGIPDICLPVPRRQYHGLYLELKYGDNQPTPEQKKWLKDLAAQGYYTAVAWGWEQAAEILMNYLEGRV